MNQDKYATDELHETQKPTSFEAKNVKISGKIARHYSTLANYSLGAIL
jgi:hypothetical protein